MKGNEEMRFLRMFAGVLSMLFGMLIMLLGLPFIAVANFARFIAGKCGEFAYEMRPEESEE